MISQLDLSVTPTTLIGIAFAGWAAYELYRTGRRSPGLPPGPPTWPLLGNLPTFPTTYMHFKFTEWAHQYGEIFSLKLGSGNVIVLNSLEAVKDVLERQSLETSNRPPSTVGNMVSDGMHFAMLQPGLCRPSSVWNALATDTGLNVFQVLNGELIAEPQRRQCHRISQFFYSKTELFNRFWGLKLVRDIEMSRWRKLHSSTTTCSRCPK